MKPQFAVKRVTVKANGVSYPTYRLTGYLHGARVRKQFKTQEEALGEKNRLEVAAANDGSVISVLTRLTVEQVALAEVAAFLREAAKISEKEREAFSKRLEDEPDLTEKSGESALLVIEKLSETDKARLMGFAFRRFVQGTIDSVILHRIYSALEIMPLWQLTDLPEYYFGKNGFSLMGQGAATLYQQLGLLDIFYGEAKERVLVNFVPNKGSELLTFHQPLYRENLVGRGLLKWCATTSQKIDRRLPTCSLAKMETVKTSATLNEADPRRTMMVMLNRKTGEERRFCFADIEARVQEIPIPANAPDEVKTLFVTAKNLLLYSWYYYPFSVTASLQASMALERALKIRLSAKPRDTLSYLLKSAVDKGIITDAGFPRWQSLIDAFHRLHGEHAQKSTRKLTDIFLEIVPDFRNSIAHGGSFLADQGFRQLDMVSEAVEQLFPTPPNS